MSDWMEIIVPATVASADDVAALLADEIAAAGLGVEIRGADVLFFAPVQDFEAVLAATRVAVARMASDWGLAADAQGISARPAAPESEWRDAWKRYFHVTPVSPRLTIVPSWESHEAGPEEIALHLDPGRAFGTGAHASTRLLLCELDDLARAGRSFKRALDVGTGSGILAIAAGKLWPACRALAVDIVPMAVDAARENVARNQLADRIECADTPIAEVEGRYDLVLANIQSSILLELADDICARVAAGGILLLSGLLTQQAQLVAEQYAQRPQLSIAAVRESSSDTDWASVQLHRAR